MKRICSICARGGSKGVPSKNLKLVAGIPLIAHSILQAKNTGLFDIIAVSSDSPQILEVSREYGASYLVQRDPELAQDHSPKLPVIRDCVRKAQESLGVVFDSIIDLDCTSPLRDTEDIVKVVELLESCDLGNIITGAPSRRSPYFNMLELSSDGTVHLAKELQNGVFRRQDAPKTYDMNASIYAWRKTEFFEEINSVILPHTKLYIMPEERSIDIDSPLDFQIVSFLLERKNEKA